MIIAVDFDNTLTQKGIFPITGKINYNAISYVLELQKNGHTIILHTARTGKYLEEAIKLCKDNGLVFDDIKEKFDADYYIDDKAIRPEELF